jgi:hypothetical protein
LSDHFAGEAGGDRIIYVLRPQIVSHQLISKVHLQRRGAAVRFKVHIARFGCRLQHLLDFLGEIFQLIEVRPKILTDSCDRTPSSISLKRV